MDDNELHARDLHRDRTERVERLTRERDEARAELAGWRRLISSGGSTAQVADHLARQIEKRAPPCAAMARQLAALVHMLAQQAERFSLPPATFVLTPEESAKAMVGLVDDAKARERAALARAAAAEARVSELEAACPPKT